MADMNFDSLGRYIYGTQRAGGNMDDLKNWMADDLGVPRLPSGGEPGEREREIFEAFFAKYAENGNLQENFQRYMDKLAQR